MILSARIQEGLSWVVHLRSTWGHLGMENLFQHGSCSHVAEDLLLFGLSPSNSISSFKPSPYGLGFSEESLDNQTSYMVLASARASVARDSK